MPYTRGAVIVRQIRSSMRVPAERHDEHGTHLTVRADPVALERIRIPASRLLK
ncbi:MAG: hypothetical protein R3F43_11700 [bacterium]